MNRNEFELLYLIKKQGLSTIRDMSKHLNLSVGTISNAKKYLLEKKYINESNITQSGLDALKPYRVNNAVIMAAGMSSRFVPISLEKPKGLLEVKGEILIERQIRQLQEAGINDITIVLGYKKESFFYLEKKFNGVKIVINPEYNIKNNTYTLYLVRNILGNTYICSSDDYFVNNVFEEYVFNSYYAGIHVFEKVNEYYMIKGHNDIIQSITTKPQDEGFIMLGHAYWNKEFSNSMVKILEENNNSHEYDNDLWENILMENIKKFPPMEVKTYQNNVIFEFDSLDELRQFDKTYIKNTRSSIIKNICKVFKCDEDEIIDFKPIKEGMTNDSFVFTLRNKKYVYRNPGDGTNEIINRSHEKRALEIAKEIGVDPTFICMDEKEGWKISYFVENFTCPDYYNKDDTARVIKLLRRLHKNNTKVDWEYLPYEDMLELEKKVREKGPIEMVDYDEIKERVTKIHQKIQNDGIERRLCHCDVYSPNLLFTKDQTILIDWEYGGNADPGCDLAVYIMCASYTIEQSIEFIKEYLGFAYTKDLEYHFLAYVAICSFYWLTWALYREACGAVMGEAIHNWYCMARDYSLYLLK